MAGFTKLFSDIVDSSIWDEDPATCKVWITLLALSNQYGYVRGSIAWLAHKAKVPVDKCQQAVDSFKNPDPISRNPDNDGRRIKDEERGWRILNYVLFRSRDDLSNDPRAVYQREWVKEKRGREKSASSRQTVDKPVDIVDMNKQGSTPASASVSVPVLKREESVREERSTPMSTAERISLEKSLDRIEAELKTLGVADLEPAP